MQTLTLTPRALYQEVAELLRERIFSNQLPPGSWIDEMALADEYGISRTPLREAIKVYSAWPTIPQLYAHGEFLGGADITAEMHERGELKTKLATK